MSDTNRIELTGLSALDPLGYLAALGCLAAATEHCEREGLAVPKLHFVDSAARHAVLDGPFADVDTLVGALTLDLDRCAGRAGGEGRDPFLGFEYEVKGKPVRDLKPPPSEFRDRVAELLCAESPPFRALDWFSATLTDVAVDNNGNAKPFALHFTAGQQRFLTIAVELLDGANAKAKPRSGKYRVAADDLRAAVIGPWPNDRDLKVFSWSPTQERAYALRAEDPSGDQKRGTPGADWLALRGLVLLSSAPQRDRIKTSGVDGGWKNGSFSYPVWSTPMDQYAATALLRHPALVAADGDAAARYTLPPGVVRFTCQIGRSDQGGYGSFSHPSRG